MATTTFSGPIRAGTIKNTTGTTVGTDVANVGQVVMAQTFSLDLSGGAVAAQVTNVVIPANSQIIDCVIDIITAASGATNLSIGDTVGGAATILNTFASGTDAGRVYPTTQAGAALAWQGYWCVRQAFDCNGFCCNKRRSCSVYYSVSTEQ